MNADQGSTVKNEEVRVRDSMLEWLKDHPGLIFTASASVALLVAGILIVPGAVARLPADFFIGKHRKPSLWLNIAGWSLVVVGLALLILPGPGAVVLLAGIVLADFPGKRRLLRWFLGHGRILAVLNRIRARRGKPLLQRP